MKSLNKETIFDAETGAPLSVSLASWNAREGRLDLNANTILRMGTGSLDIKKHKIEGKTLNIKQINNQNSSINANSKNNDAIANIGNCILPPINKSRHPLVTKFLDSGPLNPKVHRFWNATTGQIDDNYKKAVLKLPDYESIGDTIPTFDGDDDDIGDDDMSGEIDDLSNVSELKTQLSPLLSNLSLSPLSPQQQCNRNLSVMNNSTLQSPTNVLSSGMEIKDFETTKNWRFMEEKFYHEIYSTILELEKNKLLTKEMPIKGGMTEVSKVCRQLAIIKMKSFKELYYATQDEKEHEAARLKLESECTNPRKLRDLEKTHGEQRQHARRYLLALQQDNEIIFLRKMSDMGYLW
eukprot:gene6214-8559_t